jgi:hypothetical protein
MNAFFNYFKSKILRFYYKFRYFVVSTLYFLKENFKFSLFYSYYL